MRSGAARLGGAAREGRRRRRRRCAGAARDRGAAAGGVEVWQVEGVGAVCAQAESASAAEQARTRRVGLGP